MMCPFGCETTLSVLEDDWQGVGYRCTTCREDFTSAELGAIVSEQNEYAASLDSWMEAHADAGRAGKGGSMTEQAEVRSAADDPTRCHVCSYGSMWTDDAQGCESCGRGVCKEHWSQCESCPSDVRHCSECMAGDVDGASYCQSHIEHALINELLETTEALVYRALSAPRMEAA